MDHQTITAERGRRAEDLRTAAIAALEQQSIAAGVMLDLDSDQVVVAGPKAAIVMLLGGAAEESFADTYNGLLGMAKKAGFASVGDAIRAAAKAEVARIERAASPAPTCDNKACEGGYIYSTAHTLRAPCPKCAASPATASGDELRVERIAELAEASEYLNHGNGQKDFDRLGFARAVEREVRAAVSAATKPTADLRKLTVYEFSAFEDGSRQQYALLTDVQSLLATKPAAAQADQSIIGKLLDGFSEIEHMWGLNEPGALVRHRDVFNLIVAVGKAAAAPMASTDAVVEAREQAFEDAAARCESAELLFDVDELMHRTKKELTAITANKLAEEIRALKRTKAAGAEGAR